MEIRRRDYETTQQIPKKRKFVSKNNFFGQQPTIQGSIVTKCGSCVASVLYCGLPTQKIGNWENRNLSDMKIV